VGHSGLRFEFWGKICETYRRGGWAGYPPLGRGGAMQSGGGHYHPGGPRPAQQGGEWVGKAQRMAQAMHKPLILQGR
jgi:hypothetical protein